MAKRNLDSFKEGDIPDLTGKVIIVTGGTSGIGKTTCEALARHSPAQIFLLSRKVEVGRGIIKAIQPTAPKVKLTFIPCDLSSVTSVQRAAAEFTTLSPRLDLLICNAGVCMVPAAQTQEGYEIHFGTNHLSHALLTTLLLPTLLRTATAHPDVRVLFISSNMHLHAPPPGIAFADLRTTQGQLTPAQRYCQSKLANIVYARELARRFPQLNTVPLHPGIVDTDIAVQLSQQLVRWKWLARALSTTVVAVRRALGYEMLTAEEGARTTLWAATAPPEEVVSGVYYDPVGVVGELSEAAGDEKLAITLWEWTQKELEAYS